ncbi:hypothetical protein BpHYR1_013304 [Brachionus plicatilis]|uniref:Uncharacterized protein n=1 Tax=Brachionus plicatilis TaxID=10195 RepID=A0A3M7R5F8_BRAPC|nr:hypothetical protein BpHYR1_013304 [Brachionus plicatilis]
MPRFRNYTSVNTRFFLEKKNRIYENIKSKCLANFAYSLKSLIFDIELNLSKKDSSNLCSQELS